MNIVLKYLSCLVFVSFVLSCGPDAKPGNNATSEELSAEKSNQVKEKREKKPVAKKVEEPTAPDTYPIYPGCTETEYEARRKCGQQLMMKDLQKVLKYPQKAVDDKVNGTVFYSVVIEADGTMSNLELVKSLTPETDAAAYHAIEELMNSVGPWEPATLKNKPVATKYPMPIKFGFN